MYSISRVRDVFHIKGEGCIPYQGRGMYSVSRERDVFYIKGEGCITYLGGGGGIYSILRERDNKGGGCILCQGGLMFSIKENIAFNIDYNNNNNNNKNIIGK